MTTSHQKARSGMRSALAGASALVLVALVLGADIKTARPVGRDLQREVMVERAAVRHLTASLARAVRDLVGPQHQPAIHPHLGMDLGPVLAAGSWPQLTGDDLFRSPVLLRPALLDLPPPTNC